MRRLLPYLAYLKPVRGHFILALLCALIYGAANGVGFPYMVDKVLPKIFEPTAARLTGLELLLLALWMPTVFTVRGVSGYFNTYLIQYCGVRILEALRLDFFRKLQVLPLSFFQRQNSGDLMSRALSDANQLQHTLTALSNEIFKQPATLIGSIGFLVYKAYNERGIILVLVCMAVIPLCVLPIRFIGKKLARRAKQVQSELGSASDVLNENLSAAREIRAFGLEEREVGRFSAVTGNLITYQMKAVKYAKALNPAIEIISGVGISVTLVYAYRANIPWNSFFAILMALYASYEPIKKLGALSNDTRRGVAALDRLEMVLNAPVDIADPAQPVTVGRLQGKVAFNNVTFAYKAGAPALRDVTLSIPAGTTCALVGPSGAGKSTFANLVPRFYDATQGTISIDDIDVRAMRLADLRANIALVSQEAILFKDTIYNNLLLGRADATENEVHQAARDAFADDFIRSLPHGYDTVVGERGATLSGGQRQRIALARAFLRNAPILVLDEATSALDSESEAAIQQALKKLVVGKTVLIIAHRFSTIRDASMILVFDRGHVTDCGSHAELYARNPLYKALFDGQNQS